MAPDLIPEGERLFPGHARAIARHERRDPTDPRLVRKAILAARPERPMGRGHAERARTPP